MKILKVTKRGVLVHVALASLLSLCAIDSSSADGAYARKISRNNLKKQGQITCGRINKVWQPVRKVSGNMYIPYAVEYLKLYAAAPKLKGALRRKYRARLMTLHEVVPRAMRACSPLNRKTARLENGMPTFELTNKVGVALGGGSLGLSGIEANGAVTPLASSANFNHFTGQQLKIGPNGNVFATNMWWRMDESGPTRDCGVVEIDRKTGASTCITEAYIYSRTKIDRDLQFDNDGWVYTIDWNYNPSAPTESEMSILKSSNGVTTTVYTFAEPTRLDDFIVLPNGQLLLSGMRVEEASRGENWVNYKTVEVWVKLVQASGEISTLLSKKGADSWLGLRFMTPLADGRVLIGESMVDGGPLPSDQDGVVVFNPQTGKIEETPYVWSKEMAEYYGLPAPVHDLQEICGILPNGDLIRPEAHEHGFCQWGGLWIGSPLITKSGGLFAISPGLGYGYTEEKPAEVALTSLLVQYSPDLDVYKSAVWRVYSTALAGDSIVLHGLDRNNKWITTIFDTVSKRERVLLDGDDEVQVFTMRFSERDGKVLFDGRMWQNREYVFGALDIVSGELTTTPREIAEVQYPFKELQLF